MKLSEAIKFGSSLRPESHQERFCNVENRGLCSDAWGAACEAVQPAVAKFNWNPRDRFKFESAMDALRAIQQHYFKEYWSMPAQCPGATQRFVRQGAVTIGRTVVELDNQQSETVGAITSECDKVEHMAGMVDHLFYAHNWSREQVAQVVEWYEETRSKAALVHNFQHYQNESLRYAIQQRLSQAQLTRAMQRRKRIHPVH